MTTHPQAGGDRHDLLERIEARLARHPDGGRVKLMLRPPGLKLGAGEVLVEHPSELRPHQVGDPGPVAPRRSSPDDRAIDPDAAHEQWAAARLASVAYQAVVRGAGGFHPDEPRHVYRPGLFDPMLLRAMPLPIGDRRAPAQPVSLVRPGRDEEQLTDPKALAEAYATKPTTRIHFAVEEQDDGPWSLAARLLGQLAGHRVVCSVYQSRPGDDRFGTHHDGWYGVIVQLSGAKRWRIYSDGPTRPSEVTLRRGDALLLPRGISHDVDTPPDSTESVHVNLAVLTGTPPAGRMTERR